MKTVQVHLIIGTTLGWPVTRTKALGCIMAISSLLWSIPFHRYIDLVHRRTMDIWVCYEGKPGLHGCKHVFKLFMYALVFTYL